jgi:ribosomal protein L7/L12
MTSFENNRFRNESNLSRDERISQLFESSSKPGDTMVCDNCHSDYVVSAIPDDARKRIRDCPHCGHQPQRFSLTRVRLEKVKTRIGWKSVSEGARRWWESIESMRKQKLEQVLNLAILLESKEVSIEEFYKAYLQSGARGVRANLLFIDFLKESMVEAIFGAESNERETMPELPKVVLMGIPATASHGFAVTLVTYGESKVEVIKAVKRFTDLSLMELKRLIEGAPGIIGRCATAADALIIVAQINEVGGYAHVGEDD